ncbi:cupin domain-containing protein [Salinimicrobium xinjiangense]|uniref:cupin domain-containing protein n=1 Tax=Salinimicrobium xinjiangense TaxID=438596 RepID=UPI00048E9D4D|nr:cupin domain-containing protein [Salinimicrobium xinjiangense]
MKREEILETLAPRVEITTATAIKTNEVNAKFLNDGEGKKLNVLGDQMIIKLTGKDTNNQFTLVQDQIEPGVGIPLHVHDNENEIFRVLEGELEIGVGDQKRILKAGDLGFAPRGIPHYWRAVGDKKVLMDTSVFPAGLENMFSELGNLPSGPPDFAKIVDICGKYGVRFL